MDKAALLADRGLNAMQYTYVQAATRLRIYSIVFLTELGRH
jgi:hypothetical protein